MTFWTNGAGDRKKKKLDVRCLSGGRWKSGNRMGVGKIFGKIDKITG